MNVILVGIQVFECKECEGQSADIPSIKTLHASIARILVQKQSKLTGPEVRFLRKRLGKKAVDFAQMISMAPQALSAIENNEARQLAEGRDKLVRIVYKVLSGDKKLQHGVSDEDEFEKWIMALKFKGGIVSYPTLDRAQAEKILAPLLLELDEWRNPTTAETLKRYQDELRSEINCRVANQDRVRQLSDELAAIAGSGVEMGKVNRVDECTCPEKLYDAGCAEPNESDCKLHSEAGSAETGGEKA